MLWDDAATIDARLATAPKAEALPPTFASRAAPYVSLAAEHAPEIMQGAVDPMGLLARKIGANVVPAIDEVSRPGFLDRARADLGANVRAGFENAPLMGRDFTLALQYEPVMEAVNRGKPLWDQLPNPYMLSSLAAFNPVTMPMAVGGAIGDKIGSLLGGSDADSNPLRSAIEDRVWARVEQGRAVDPGTFGNLPRDRAHLLDLADFEQRSSSDYADLLASSGGGPITGAVLPFAGQAIGQLPDPENILALGLGVPASESLLATFLREGGVNLAMTGAVLPFQMIQQHNLGRDMSAGDVAAELAAAALLGGGLGVGGKLLGRLAASGVPHEALPPSVRAAATHLEGEEDIRASNPLPSTDQGVALHRQTLLDATLQMEDRVPVDVPSVPAFEVHPTQEDVASAASDIAAAGPRGVSPRRLLSEIAVQGGIRKDAGGDIGFLLTDYKGGAGNPSRARLLNDTGLSQDAMRQHLQEQGWFGGFESQRNVAAGMRPGDAIGDMHDLIDRAARGDAPVHPTEVADPAREFRRAMAEETARAGIGAGDSKDVAAQKLARYRLAQASAEDLALRHWQARALDAGVELPPHATAEDAMAAVIEHDATMAERLGHEDRMASELEAQLRDHLHRLYPEVPDAELERDLRTQAEQAPAGRPEGQGQGSGALGENAGGAEGHDPSTAGDRAAARAGGGESHLGDFNKLGDDAFARQTHDLARELAPSREKAAPPAKGAAQEPPEFGAAQDEIDALRALPQDLEFPAGDLFGKGDNETITIKAARAEIERQARAVERLRSCIEGGA